MTDQISSLGSGRTIAEELGADPEAAVRMRSDAIQPLTLASMARDLTRQYPLAMLGIAFIAGAVYAGQQRR